MRIVMAESRKNLVSPVWTIGLAAGLTLAVMTIVGLLADHKEAIALTGTGVQAALDDATRYWMNIYLPVSVVAAWGIAKEFQDGEIKRSVQLYGRNRGKLLVAKFTGLIPFAVIIAVVTGVLAAFAPPLLLRVFGIEVGAATVDMQIVAGLVGIQFIAAAWGFAIGLLLRNATLALGVLFLQTMIETYGSIALPEVGKYTYTSLLGSLYKDVGGWTMDMGLAAGLALAWVAVAMIAAVVTFLRRDV